MILFTERVIWKARTSAWFYVTLSVTSCISDKQIGGMA
jgi:hypothetical protein